MNLFAFSSKFWRDLLLYLLIILAILRGSLFELLILFDILGGPNTCVCVLRELLFILLFC